MASSRKRFTSDQVIAFFRGTESSDEEDDKGEETFSEYIGVDLSCLQGDESPQAVTDDEDAGAVGVRTFVSFPAQEDMDVERPEMSESKYSGGMAIVATRVVILRSTVDSMIREKQATSIKKLETTITAKQSTASNKKITKQMKGQRMITCLLGIMWTLTKLLTRPMMPQMSHIRPAYLKLNEMRIMI